MFGNVTIVNTEKVVFRCQKCQKVSNSLHKCSHCGYKKLKEEGEDDKFEVVLKTEMEKLKKQKKD